MPKIFLGLILVLALLLRFVQLDLSPPGFNADEAALGYNAYSILKSGKDEWGETLPLVFKSFSDYKPGLYVYLSLPFVFLMGLSELSVRLPSILLGVLSVAFIYYLSKEIFKKETPALAGSLLLAISPWHIHFSRGAWETNIATFLILSGVLTFIKGLSFSRWFYLSGLSFLAAMYTYQSPRIVVPVLVSLLALAYFKKLGIRKILGPAVFSIVISVPLLIILSSSSGWARFEGISIFTDLGIVNRTNEMRGEHQGQHSLTPLLYHNKILSYSQDFASHYLDHFNPGFLFINGDPLGRNKIPGMGQLYLFEIVTFILGLAGLIKSTSPYSKIIFIWLLAAPIAAALTYQTPHALRSHNMVVPLSIISGLGLGMVIEKVWSFKKLLRYFSTGLLICIIGFFLTNFLDQYFIHLPQKYALEWENGFSLMVPYVWDNQSSYKKIVITDKFDQAYILTLFFSKFDPLIYQSLDKKITDGKFGFSTISAFDKFEFRPISKEEVVDSKNVLFVGTPGEIQEGGTLLKTIYYPNTKVVFKIVGT